MSLLKGYALNGTASPPTSRRDYLPVQTRLWGNVVRGLAGCCGAKDCAYTADAQKEISRARATVLAVGQHRIEREPSILFLPFLMYLQKSQWRISTAMFPLGVVMLFTLPTTSCTAGPFKLVSRGLPGQDTARVIHVAISARPSTSRPRWRFPMASLFM